MSTESALCARNISVSYGRVQALEGASLELASGRSCGLVGMNGSGKSTFFKALMGLVPATGDISLFGMSSLRARRAGLVGYVPQSDDIDHAFPLSVSDVVLMGRYGFMGPTRRARVADRQACEEALERVDLPDLANRPIGALSGGQRKRVFIARALTQGAQLLLLDEPFTGVDYTSQDLITELLRSLTNQGRSLLISTHDLGSLPTLCDEAALLNRTVTFHGPVDEALAPDRLAQAFEGVRS